MFTEVSAIVLLFFLYKVVDYLYRKPTIDCTGRYVLITGCDTGFGNALAKRLDSKGSHVIATCMTEDGQQKLKDQCSSRLKTVLLDISDEAAVSKNFTTIKEMLPSENSLWGIVNNAGIVGKALGPPELLTIENYKHIMEVNLLGHIHMTMTFLPLIKKSKGRVVNIASIHGRISRSGVLPYSISKYGVEAFSDCLRRQLMGYGCSVHILEPGYHRTNILNRQDNLAQMRTAWEQASAETKEEYGHDYLDRAIRGLQDTMISRLISERIEDVVDAYEHALFASHPRARYVVGFDANYFWLPIQWLPEWLGDWIQEVLNPTPKAAACRYI